MQFRNKADTLSLAMKSFTALLLSVGLFGAAIQAQEPAFLNPDQFLTPSGSGRAGSDVTGLQTSRSIHGPVRITPGANDSAPVAQEVVEEETPIAQEVVETPVSQAAAPLVSRDRTRVAVLGYHNFSDTKPVSEMRMRTSDFRKQMEYLRTAGITAISMQDFLDWRFGTKRLPEKCALITIDDGWRSTYTDAFPILKEMGYPFTLFPYTRYITGRGDSMSREMIQEMANYGATIGSHSTSHYYPSTWKKTGQGTPAYTALIEREIGDSAKQLTAWFGSKVVTYCYPGGYHTPEMLEKLPQYGYIAAFTVIPQKVRYDENPLLIHRYMIFGNNHSIFRQAVDFSLSQENGSGTASTSSPAAASIPPFEVTPAAQSIVDALVPVIQADLSGVPELQNGSVQMVVSGFGRVPCHVDAADKIVRWKPPVRLHMPVVTVKLKWKTSVSPIEQQSVWSFRISDSIRLPKQNED